MLRRILMLVALVALCGNPGLGITVSAQEQVSARPRVNVEIILDASGSMGAITESGETRMEAAKRVLREVVNSVPLSADSINMGFRIYGHKGDNTEASKTESCDASELLVALDGVNKESLLNAIDSAQPVGWTPIGESLSRAGEDFAAVSQGAINAIVLVTDGLETCDGDPVAAAAALNNDPDLNATTYVIGFGTTAEEQLVLQGITEAGNGQLFGAGNAQQLRSALFSVLEELQIVVGAGYVGGNAFGLIPEGNPGELSVVAFGLPLDQAFPEIPFIVRNNTGEDLVWLKVGLTVRDSQGTLIAAGDSLQIFPFFVRSGGLAFGSVPFLAEGTTIPADAQFEWSVTSTDPKDARFYPAADLDIVEASLFDNRIVGTASNGFEREVDGPILSGVVCLTDTGTVVSLEPGYGDAGPIEPGETQSFQVDLFHTTFAGYSCPAFLVAAYGSGDPRLPEPRAVTASATAQPTVESKPSKSGTPAERSDDQAATAPSCLTEPSAEQVVLALRDAGLPIGDYIVFTAETDPNNLLGRPGGYTSKVNYLDTRYASSTIDFPVEDGGSVEVFATEQSAAGRFNYLESLAQSSPLFAEYHYQFGPILLRLSKQLLPQEAEEFAAVFEQLMNCE